jgi:hypothetical protein
MARATCAIQAGAPSSDPFDVPVVTMQADLAKAADHALRSHMGDLRWYRAPEPVCHA